jgi:sulfite exporter TauE/SafE
MWQVLTAGWALGMISSFHCIGMCGPLALGLPVQRLSRAWQTFAILSYHSGRVLTYATLGLLCGLLGRRIYVAGFQQIWSISLGLLLLLFVIGYGWTRSGPRISFLGRFYGLLQGWIIRLWSSPAKSSYVLLGMANGLLPCGMVYLAIAGALSTSGVKEGVVFMVFFGAGTLPAMLGISYFGRWISLSFRNSIKRSIPFLMAAMAVLLILRGLNLGIPFISPILAGSRGHVMSCH